MTLDVLAILVLYKCKLKNSETFISLNKALAYSSAKLDMLIYDNSPVPQFISEDSANINIEYISDISNGGVSKAYNIGSEIAKKKNKKWLLLLDQDTSLPVNAINIYSDFMKIGTCIGAPVLLSNDRCVSPCLFKWGRGKALKNYKLGKNEFKNLSLLNSGLLIPLKLFNAAGGYNEKIALDFSDHYFIESIKKITPYFYLLDIDCAHTFSALESDENKIYVRFIYYLKGAVEYNRRNYSSAFGLMVLFRTLKLTLRFRSFIFLQAYWKEFLM